MKGLAVLFSGLLLALSSSAVLPHGGGLDGYGCHHNRKQGGYHCHRGEMAGQSFASQNEMLAAKQKAKPSQSRQQSSGKPTSPEKRLGQ